MTDPDGIQWKRKSFKGNKVWAAHDPDGKPLVRNGKIRIKYNLDQDYEYRVSPESLHPEDQAVPAADRRPDQKLDRGKGREKKKAKPSGADLQDLPENSIRIYTDGASSGNPGPSGIGVLLIYKEHRREISEYIGRTTNNVAELTAIQRALASLKRQDLPVRIFTDSDYAVGLLSRDWTPQSNRELVSGIRALMKQFPDIEIIKVKGHAGVKENEVADFLAVSAVKRGKERE